MRTTRPLGRRVCTHLRTEDVHHCTNITEARRFSDKTGCSTPFLCSQTMWPTTQHRAQCVCSWEHTKQHTDAVLSAAQLAADFACRPLLGERWYRTLPLHGATIGLRAIRPYISPAGAESYRHCRDSTCVSALSEVRVTKSPAGLLEARGGGRRTSRHRAPETALPATRLLQGAPDASANGAALSLGVTVPVLTRNRTARCVLSSNRTARGVLNRTARCVLNRTARCVLNRTARCVGGRGTKRTAHSGVPCGGVRCELTSVPGRLCRAGRTRRRLRHPSTGGGSAADAVIRSPLGGVSDGAQGTTRAV